MSQGINILPIVNLKVLFKEIITVLKHCCDQFQECSCKDISFGSIDEVLMHGCQYDNLCAKKRSTFDTASLKMVSALSYFIFNYCV